MNNGLHFLKSFYRLLLLGLLLGVGGFAMADCKMDYKQAVDQLDGAKKSIAANKNTDQDALMRDFRMVVMRMQTARCMSELMDLMEHIQAEQRKYGPRQSVKTDPIMD